MDINNQQVSSSRFRTPNLESRAGKLFDFHTSTLTSLAINESLLNKTTTTENNNKQQDEKSKIKRASAGWFHMEVPILTPEVERDLRMIRLRKWANPKQFFKTDDYVGKKGELPEFFQLGTVVAGLGDRSLTRKQTKQSVTKEMLSNETARTYAKRVFNEVQMKKKSGGINSFKKRYKQFKGSTKKDFLTTKKKNTR